MILEGSAICLSPGNGVGATKEGTVALCHWPHCVSQAGLEATVFQTGLRFLISLPLLPSPQMRGVCLRSQLEANNEV